MAYQKPFSKGHMNRVSCELSQVNGSTANWSDGSLIC